MGFCNCSTCVLHYSVSVLLCNNLDGEERASCFALLVVLVSRDRCVALPIGAQVCLQFVIVVFHDHAHLQFLFKNVRQLHYGR